MTLNPHPNETLSPIALRCENAEDPLGVDNDRPRLSWRIAGDRRGARQTAYQIVAASTLEALTEGEADLWDSGRAASGATLHQRYDGRPLRAFQPVFWRVRIWDEAGRVSDWSAPAHWTMGALEPADWEPAHWISVPELLKGLAEAPPRGALERFETLLLRRDISVRPGLKRALALATGLGHYEMTVNGTKVGTDLLPPGWTEYKKTVLYDTHDITSLLRTGDNAAGLLLGNGFYNVHGGRYTKMLTKFAPLQAICLLRLEYEDGTVESVGTDANWQAQSGPITFSCMFGGEDHDARREMPGWDGPGFDASDWTPAVVHDAGPGGTLRGASYAGPSMRAHETLQPVEIRPIRDGLEVYDLGQNVSLMPRLKVRGPSGAAVRITPAELLKDDGTVDRVSCGGREAYWSYTLTDGQSDTAAEWFPRFFYHGSRYLQVERIPAQEGGEAPTVERLEGVIVHTASPPIGDFVCSSDHFSRVRTLIRWAQRSNLAHLITDCPHRERLGWLEQYHLNGPSLRYEFDLTRLYQKCFVDITDAQTAEGLVPDIAPEFVVFNDGFRDSPEWGSALILSAWQHYIWTGDEEPLRRYYSNMQRYAQYLKTKSEDDLLSYGLGDWYDIGPNPPGYAQLTPMSLTATAHFYMCVTALSEIARILGRDEDAEASALHAEAIRDAFNRALLKSGPEGYATGSQCANSLPLVAGLVPPADRERVVSALVRDIESRDYGLTAGDVGHRYLLRALADAGRSDVIYRMHSGSDKPGYGYQLAQGCTSLAEAWDAGRHSSHNHFMLGQIMEWFYHDLAGIGPDPAAPGFKNVLVRPQPVEGVTWARARYDSPRGPISVEWRTDESAGFTLTVTIPVNVTATVYIPTDSPDGVTESGIRAADSPGVRHLRQEEGRAVYAVDSGSYRFVSLVPPPH